MLSLLLDLHSHLTSQASSKPKPERYRRTICNLPTRERTTSTLPRSAVCRAINILVTYQNFNSPSSSSNTSSRNLDPICHIALCISALIIWTYCQFHNDDYPTCRQPGPDLTTAIELTALSSDSPPSSSMGLEKEAWIETGENSRRPLVHGVQLCRCNIGVLIRIFRGYVPEGWGLVDVVAPGIF
ncbi:hypothetical protein LAWI1_G006087 [Lachnellula willkommii]|uniref:Uncharacterized protein n=1 Tax=Lachnellula willkommii TaxID=215461 RepID=A0A559M0Z9_9HELO|nr:hypothetical protein LAWI1_G006087 [Lachnellula willkommii]